MGGNLFKLGRRPRGQYLLIEDAVRDVLHYLLGGDGYRIPRYYASKPDFGDLDVIVSRAAIEMLGGWDRFCNEIATRLEVTQSKSVGHVYSTVAWNFQVDYFIRAPELFEATYHYMSFNDLGNLIGKIFRRLGLKYGEHGLSYVFRRESQPSYKHELLVSRDWPKILGFLELDVAAWEAGFDDLEQMFRWVVASPYFSVAPYQNQDRARTTERRARSRPTMARFIAWLEAEGVDKRCDYLEGRDAYVEQIAAAFPEAGLVAALARERAREQEAAALRSKFSGGLVREWTGLEGPQLGAFLRRFGEAYPSETLATMEGEAIRAAVEGFARPKD
ncbi:MAG: hypothetical protein R6X02_17645 [Enhygromyxa sp.]